VAKEKVPKAFVLNLFNSFGAVVVAEMAAAAADAFTPECKEYRDVQELLYADPIHEVEEETGWTPEKS